MPDTHRGSRPVRVTRPGPPGGAPVELLAAGPEQAWLWSEHRRLAAGLVAAVVLVGGGIALTSGAPAQQAAPQPSPSPTRAPGPSPTPARVVLGMTMTLSTDTVTTVSVAHLRLAGRSVQEQVQLAQQALEPAGLHLSYRFRPDPVRGALGRDDPAGVEVQFAGRLGPADEAAARAALVAVAGEGADVGTVPGTTVDVSVPVDPGAPCLRGRGDRRGELVLAEADLDTISSVLPFFSPTVSGARAVVSYVGPELTAAQITQVGQALASSCGVASTTASATRHLLP